MTALSRLAVFALALWAAHALAEPDPLDSARWGDMRAQLFDGATVVFDPRVGVTAPLTAEDPMNVPIAVDASALSNVVEVLVFADFNPITKVLAFRPLGARAELAFRIKLQQSSPVRAAARTGDGVWHVGGTWVITTGGGCTVPSTGSASPEWQSRLNEVSGRIWSRPEGNRVRVRIIHPMDTGLAASIPAFYIEQLAVTDSQQRVLMEIDAFEPVSENPLFTLDLPPEAGELAAIRITGRDNNGNRVDAQVAR
ncbi:quinoprotein dehydrogenase-associated SoxYZ-like carrier [Denitromonas iodatirespirans]|uniref:Quinoprotein dehydrogenase-associated SoxYZ-like carrier n=1 Tax=Denitromonas iodatirespirans TaxID=2795389 RepID=A0A944DAI7_DENI1|nr:quinoprotein dehydrogenase-associated SoxYZ-like carrier [Denitromonas iodatirespirans]MBT0961531.1 quinoprotein dehydrogenase-associated SoxYZ-like carrier [Denitromonas iodatirespirans]